MSLLHSGAFMAHFAQCKVSAKQQVNSMIDAIYAKVLLDLELWLNKHETNEAIKNEIDSDCEENVTHHNNLPGESQFDMSTEASNDHLQNKVSLSNTIHTESTIKQEFDDDDGEEIDDDNVEKCEKCDKGICNSVRENYDNASDCMIIRKNRDEQFETQFNFYVTLENNQITQSIISNDISPSPSPSPTNPINTQPLIKHQCLQSSSITSIGQLPLDFINRNAALNDISIDDQIEEQNTQIQTDEFGENEDVNNDCDGGEGEYLNQAIYSNEVCDLDRENNNNHWKDDGPVGDDDEANFDEAQLQINISVTNNTQMDNQNDKENDNTEKCVSERNMEQSTPSTSGVRSSTRKQIQTKVFGDLVQSNHGNNGKRKNDHANESVKKVKPKCVLNDEDIDDYDDQEEHAINVIGEEIATECTINPIQPKLAQPNRPYQCSHCPKSFDRKSDLQRHVRVHTGERPFHCDLCDQRFSDKGNLTKHQLIHQNIKNFQCPECDQRFTQKSSLDSHLRTHSGERPFACRHCDKSFTTSDTRKKHEQAIHLHVKPFRCKQCGQTSTERSHIIRHIRVVHFGLPQTIKQQRELNIVDDRDPKELMEKV